MVVAALGANNARSTRRRRTVADPCREGPQPQRPREENALSHASAARLDTVPKLLLRNAEQFRARPALRHKDLGIWQTWTWEAVRDEVRAFAVGLRKLGLERGDAVAIIGDNRPRLYATFAAVQSIGGIAGADLPGLGGRRDGLRPRPRGGQIRGRAEPGAGRQAHLHRRADAEALAQVVYDEERGLAGYDPPSLHSFEHVAGAGPRRDARATPAPPAGGSTRSPRARARTSA